MTSKYEGFPGPDEIGTLKMGDTPMPALKGRIGRCSPVCSNRMLVEVGGDFEERGLPGTG